MSNNTETNVSTAYGNNLVLIYENSIDCGNNVIIKEQIYKDPNKENIKLFKNGVELTENIDNAFSAFIYDNEHWGYKDFDKFVHLFKDNKELTINIKTTGVLKHPQTKQWVYANEQNRLVLLPTN